MSRAAAKKIADGLATAIRNLERSVAGEIVAPDHPAYDDARRVYNGMHDRFPALVLRAASTDDVAPAILFAREHHLDLAIRGGGHSGPGYGTCDEGIVLDLSGLREVTVDAGKRIARAQPGATVADLDQATTPHGLATTAGTISSTGLAGLTLGGGFGHLTRRCGLVVDNLLAAEVVTADGDVLLADGDTNADLFWALRGGGGNFGVVTRFEYRLHPIGPTVTGGPIVFPMDASGRALRAWADLMEVAPDDLGGIFGLGVLPPFPFVAPEHHGTPGAIALICWTGDPDAADEVLARLRAAAPALGEGIGPMPYAAMNTLFDELLPAGLIHYWKSNFVRELSDDAIAAHEQHASRWTTPQAGTFFFPLGGAAARVGAGETAFGHRDARFAMLIAGIWPASVDGEPHLEMVRAYWDAVRGFGDEGGYVNFMAADDGGRAAANYGAGHDRLARIKATYDPGNLFHLNHNIPPHAG